MVYKKAVSIEWDADCQEDLQGLPGEIEIPPEMTDVEDISDYLTNLTGFCHRGFVLHRSGSMSNQ